MRIGVVFGSYFFSLLIVLSFQIWVSDHHNWRNLNFGLVDLVGNEKFDLEFLVSSCFVMLCDNRIMESFGSLIVVKCLLR